MALDITITNKQKENITINPVTLRGVPAKVDGVPVWEVLSGNSTVEVAADGLSAFIVSEDTIDTTTVVKASADADLGEGVETIEDTITVHVVAEPGEKASSLGLVAESAVPK
jgi:hypothetical protein